MFEAAREAMEKGEASQPVTDSQAPQTNDQSSSDQNQGASAYAPQEPAQQAQSTVQELEKLEKFMFKGKEYTARELESAMMRQQDYTQKTQEIAAERRFSDNLRYDLESVAQNPSLAEQFKSIYPEKYHGYLNFVLNNVRQAENQAQPQSSEQSWKNDPELMRLKQEVKEWKDFQTQEQQKQAEKTIDNILETMATKFKVSKEMRTVAEEMVISRANVAITQNLPLNNDTWEKIYSGVHKELTGIAKSYNQALVSKQQEANRTARDASSGGQTPGQSPKRMSFREATDAAIRDAKNA